MLVIDFVGVFAFALSGGLAAVRRRFDVFGVLVLALVTALGGGVVRDVMLGITPPRNITNVPLLATAIIAGLVTFRFSGTVERARRTILVADALGLAAFSVSGAVTAIEAGHPGAEAVVMAVVTAVGGGMVRDVLSGQVPSVFTEDFYALAALIGGLLTDTAARLHLLGPAAKWGLVAFLFVLRIVAIKWHWHAPKPRRLEREHPAG